MITPDKFRHDIINPILQIEAVVLRRLVGYPEHDDMERVLKLLNKNVAKLGSLLTEEKRNEVNIIE